MSKNRFESKNHTQHLLINALKTHSPPLENGEYPDLKEWLTTRQLADFCHVSIYSATHNLHDLVRQGIVTVSSAPVSRSLRWYILNESIKNNDSP